MKSQAAIATDGQIISTPSSSLPDTSSMLVQVSGALTLIILIILCVAWLAKRFGLVAKHSVAKGMKIDASLSLGGRERLIIVAVEDTRLLLGVTNSQITCLHTLPLVSDSDTAINLSTKPSSDFAGLFKKLLNKKISSRQPPNNNCGSQ